MENDPIASPSRRQTLKYAVGSLGAPLLIGESRAREQKISIRNKASTIILENDHLRLQLSKQNGGIEQIVNLDEGVRLRDPNGPERPQLWDIRFYSDEFSWLSTNAWNEPAVEITETATAGEISLTWENPPLSTPDDPDYDREFDATITATIRLEADSTDLQWDFDLTNQDSLAVRRVQYPIISNVSELATNSQDSLVLPIDLGRIVSNPTQTDHWYQVRHPSGFGTMQFTAYTSPEGGFYIQSEDTEGYVKKLSWGAQAEDVDRVKFFHQFDAPREPGSDIAIPYSLMISAFSGDWHDAADRYQSWLTANGMLPDEPHEIPDWYYEQGASVNATSYSRSNEHPERQTTFETTVDRLVQTKEQLDTPMQFIWNGYQTHGKYGYGDWIPPYEGWESFRESIQKLKNHDISPAAFVGATNLYKRSDLWDERREEAEEWVIRDKDGSPRTGETIGFADYQVHFYADGWYQEIRETTHALASAGVNQIWIDGFPWGSAPNFSNRTCYAESHDHPPGVGGKWWANRTKETLGELKEELLEINDSLLLSGEGTADYFIPELDIQHTRDVLKEFRGRRSEAEPIPLTKYAFGDYLLVRGNITAQLLLSHQYPSFVRLGLARSLNWGTLPAFLVSVHRGADELLSEELINYASRIAKQFQIHGQRFLTGGNLLRKPPVESPETEVKVNREFLGREEDKFTTTSLQVSAWENDSGKERAVLLTNIAAEDVNVTLSLSDHPFTRGDSDRLYYAVNNGDYRLIRQETDSEAFESTVSQHDVLLLVSAPAHSDRREAIEKVVKAQHEMNNAKTIETAQAAFAEGAYDDVVSILEEASQRTAIETETDVGTSTATEAETPTRTDVGTRTSTEAETTTRTASRTITEYSTSETTKTGPTTGEDGPGFGITSILGALGGAGYLLKSRIKDDE